MLVGKQKHVTSFQKKTDATIKFAIETLKDSFLSAYISEVYLYGSTARGTNRFDSDVDLLICISENCPDDLRKKLRELRIDLMPENKELSDTDAHFVVGQHWKDNRSIYYTNVMNDGVEIWKKHV